MGTDIHLFREQKVENKWTALDTWEKSHEEGLSRWETMNEWHIPRNYDLFGFLAGVRIETTHMVNLDGFPPDASTEVEESFKEWDCDAHSPNHLRLDAALEWQTMMLRRKILGDTDGYEHHYRDQFTELIDRFELDETDDTKDFRMVYWFDN
jgi:hypothetical protein